jgi:hypothetical protein
MTVEGIPISKYYLKPLKLERPGQSRAGLISGINNG